MYRGAAVALIILVNNPGSWSTLDRALLGAGHLYQGEGLPFDPEGLASTAPAIAQVLLGWWAGTLLLGRRADAQGVARLCTGAVALLVAAVLWQLDMPLNKKIWTPSYVLLRTGLAMLALALCIQLIEIRQRPAELRMWVRFFEVFGRNPLFIFVLSGLVPRFQGLLRWPAGKGSQGAVVWTTPLTGLQQSVFLALGADPRLGSLLFAVANVLFYAAIAAWLDRRGLYFRV